MPDAPVSPSSGPAPVDGLTAAPSAATVPLSPDSVSIAKRRVLAAASVLYGVYILWCMFLLVTLPSPTGEAKQLTSIGLLSCLSGAVVLLLTGGFLLRRISSSPSSVATRRRSLIKIILALIPGLVISAIVPLLITREPALPIDITDPLDQSELVAPVSVTLSADRAASILRKLGHRVLKYQWDTDGDGKLNDETILPTTTVVYERQGAYQAVVRIVLDGGDFRRVVKRVVIPYGVFSVIPAKPVVERGVKFSVTQLLKDPKQLKQVVWDFGDGNPPVTMTLPDIAHTFYSTGSFPVSAVVQLLNQSQVTYKKTVIVVDPPPLPFPITLITTPKNLVGPAPFGAIFKLQTDEPLREISWSFGDGKENRGADIIRESHSFDSPGIYPVIVRARSGTGRVAELNAIVRVTEVLNLRDLTFEGKPPVVNAKISGEVPVEINLTPKTSTPLVQFSWEIPDDSDLQVTDGALRGVFRKEGVYTVTLMAQGAEEKSQRIPITIEVKPPSAQASIVVKPDGGTAPLTVTFDASQTFVPPGETIAGFKWLYGDEGQGAKNAEVGSARVQHTYKDPGEYTARLSVVLVSGKEYTAQRTIIVRRPSLSACITPSRLSVQAGKGINFDSACSTGITTSLLWDVRSTSRPEVVLAQSGDKSYIYVFEEPGTYTVTLTLKDQFGNQDKKSVTIEVSEPVPVPEPAPEPEPSAPEEPSP